jgi:DNA-binding NarL/FixJ family response regulator
MGKPIRVLICDDHTLFRQGVKSVLSSKPDIQVIGEASDGSDLLYKLRHSTPDVILLDINMPNLDGMAVLPILKSDEKYKDIKVIILSMHNQMSMVTKMMSLGANSYLTKSDDVELIYNAIVACHNNEYFFNELTNKALLTAIKKNPEIVDGDEEFIMIEEKRKEKLAHQEQPKINVWGNIIKGGTIGLIAGGVMVIAYIIYVVVKNLNSNIEINNYNP